MQLTAAMHQCPYSRTTEKLMFPKQQQKNLRQVSKFLSFITNEEYNKKFKAEHYKNHL